MSQKPKYILNDRLRLKRQLQLRVAFLVMFVVIWVVPHDNVIVRIVSLISILFAISCSMVIIAILMDLWKSSYLDEPILCIDERGITMKITGQVISGKQKDYYLFAPHPKTFAWDEIQNVELKMTKVLNIRTGESPQISLEPASKDNIEPCLHVRLWHKSKKDGYWVSLYGYWNKHKDVKRIQSVIYEYTGKADLFVNNMKNPKKTQNRRK